MKINPKLKAIDDIRKLVSAAGTYDPDEKRHLDGAMMRAAALLKEKGVDTIGYRLIKPDWAEKISYEGGKFCCHIEVSVEVPYHIISTVIPGAPEGEESNHPIRTIQTEVYFEADALVDLIHKVAEAKERLQKEVHLFATARVSEIIDDLRKEK
jgi:hypothetical protein